MIGYRARGTDYPHLPKSLNDVVIPERFASTLDGEVLYRGRTHCNMYLFMSETMCKILSEGEKLFVDGTFSTICEPFPQMGQHLTCESFYCEKYSQLISSYLRIAAEWNLSLLKIAP